jgi:hypothetical protein
MRMIMFALQDKVKPDIGNIRALKLAVVKHALSWLGA